MLLMTCMRTHGLGLSLGLEVPSSSGKIRGKGLENGVGSKGGDLGFCSGHEYTMQYTIHNAQLIPGRRGTLAPSARKEAALKLMK